MSKILHLFLILFSLLLLPVFSGEPENRPRAKQPNWRFEVIETFIEGTPKRLRYFEPVPGKNEERPVKEMTLRRDGTTATETDLSPTLQPHGPSILYGTSGTIEQIALYVDGHLQGRSMTFYPTGVLKRVVTYRNGILEGATFTYYENGKILEKGFYSEGKISGKWERFSNDGVLIASLQFVEGLPHGEALRMV